MRQTIKTALTAVVLTMSLAGPALGATPQAAPALSTIGLQPDGSYKMPSGTVIPPAPAPPRNANGFQSGLSPEVAKATADLTTALLISSRQAADKGYAGAQFDLGAMYFEGSGVTRDYVEAVKWYRLAATQGNGRAQFNLGLMYAAGQGVTQDYAEAIKWYRLAADQGDADAQNNLGVMYAAGQGVTQDYVQAHTWFNIAASRYSAFTKQDRDRAVRNRDSIAAKMTPAQIAEAQAMARKCQASNFKQCD
jgi:hypothetical protein